MAEEIIRPNGDNSISWNRSAGSTNASCVDESVADDGDYVVTPQSENTESPDGYYDTYTLGNPSNQSGTINSVTVYARLAQNIGNYNYSWIHLYIGSTRYNCTAFYQNSYDNTYATYHFHWTTNPATSAAWGSDWSVINDLSAGILGGSLNFKGYKYSYCSQLYVVVDYTEEVKRPQVLIF